MRKEIKNMTREVRMAQLKERINKLEENGKNVKCPGVLRKLRRQLRNM